ncbi:interleukin-18 receptor accessory protein-like [Leptodactylus fuscus]
MYVTFLVCSVTSSAVEEAAVSDCLDKDPHYRYAVYAGETVYFQCTSPSYKIEAQNIECEEPETDYTIQWYLQKPDGSLEDVKSRKNLNISEIEGALQMSPLERKHSGTYICRSKNFCMKMEVHVSEKKNCQKYGPTSLYFTNSDNGATVSCPSINCHEGNNITNVTWYKTVKFLPVKTPCRFSIELYNNSIQFNTLYAEKDNGIYTCDYPLYDSGNEWIIRGTVMVTVDVEDTKKPPDLFGPFNGSEIEAELGKPIELKCRIIFGYERYFNPVIKWTVLHSEVKEECSGKNCCSKTDNGIKGYDCTVILTLNTVTENDLHSIFQCFGQNTVGNVTTTVKLSRKREDLVIRRYILYASVVLLLIMLIGAGTVYVFWVEIVLLYRHYLSKDETIGDDKDFDAFISYAVQTSEFSEETTESSYDNYVDEQFATQLLPSVLEDHYNYKLCILERDILPGGAYVEDIAKIIKQSRRAIFVLSQRYITGPKLFELQAAITCSLEEQESLKLILIKLNSFKEPENIPHIVKKALRALPTISWKGDLNSKSSYTTKFWRKIRYYMPVKKKRGNVNL